MGGMCVGSLWLPRFAAAWLPLRAYALLEAGIGALGALTLPLILFAGRLYPAATGSPDLVLRALVAGVCLLPATVLMGATLPVVARCFEGVSQASARLGVCYAANVVGGVIGCMAGAFWLLRVYDAHVATRVAVLLNFAVAVVAWRLRLPVASSQAGAAALSALRATNWPVYVAAGASGFTALACEVLWTRQLALLIGGTVYALALV